MERKKLINNCIKIVISMLLVGVIAVQADWRMMKTLILSVDRGYLALAFLFLVAEVFVMSVRVAVLLSIKSIKVPLRDLVKMNFMSIFGGIFLPTKLGMDGLRIYFLARHTSQPVDSVSTIALDRFFNMIVLTVFATISYFIAGYYQILPGLIWIIAPMLAGIVFVCGFFLPRVRSATGRWMDRVDFFRRLRLNRIMQWITEVVQSFYDVKFQSRRMVLLFALIILFQINRTVTTYFFAKAMHIDVSFMYYFLFMPLVIIVGMLPFAVAGLGITQFGQVYLFKMIGVSVESGLGFSMLVYFSLIIASIPGLYFLYKEGFDQIVKSISRMRIAQRAKKSPAS